MLRAKDQRVDVPLYYRFLNSFSLFLQHLHFIYVSLYILCLRNFHSHIFTQYIETKTYIRRIWIKIRCHKIWNKTNKRKNKVFSYSRSQLKTLLTLIYHLQFTKFSFFSFLHLIPSFGWMSKKRKYFNW